MTEERTVDELIKEIKTTASRLEHHIVYYEMRRWGTPHIRKEAVELMKIFIAAHQYGLPLTCELASVLTGRRRGTLITSIHQLGDKGLLTLSKYNMLGVMLWSVNPIFLKQMEKPTDV